MSDLYTAWIDPETRGSIPSSLFISPTWASVNDRGGSYKAEFSITGATSALWEISELLGRKIHITSGYGSDVWRGIIDEISFSIGSFSASFAYANMYNRVRVLYSFDGPDGQPGTGVTEWVQDSDSTLQHGIREMLHSMADTFQGEAERERDRLLDEFKEPKGTPSLGAIRFGGTISARGAFHFNQWRFFERLSGRFEHSFSPTVEMALGWSLTGSGFSMIFSKLHDIDARIDTLAPGDNIVITGNTASAGEILEVTGEPSGTESLTRSGSNIWLDPSDEIYINAPGNWDGFRAEEVVLISGSASHDFNHAIEDVVFDNNPQYLDTNGGFGSITEQENDQGTITLTVKQGASIEIESGGGPQENPFNENLTIDAVGQEVEQSFVSNFTGDAQLIAIPVMKVGTPSDYLSVSLYSDSGGSRGSLLATISIEPGDLPDVVQEIWIELANPVQFVDGGTYYLVIGRTGANSNADHYRIGFTEDVILETGTLRLKAGATWFTYTDRSLPFMVYATEDTALQMEKILEVSNQHAGAYSFFPAETGIRTNFWADGRQRADLLLEEALDKGIDGGRRLIVLDDPDFNMIVFEEPARGNQGSMKKVWSDRRVTTPGGGGVPRGELPVGEWVEQAEVPSDTSGIVGELSPVYIQSAEVDFTSGDPPKLRARNLSVNDRIGAI